MQCPSSASKATCDTAFPDADTAVLCVEACVAREEEEGSGEADFYILIFLFIVALLLVAYQVYKISTLWKQSRRVVKRLREHKSVGSGMDAEGKNYKIEYRDISFGKEIGTGATGKVSLAVFREHTLVVKELINTVTREELEKDFDDLVRVRHPHLVLFMGISTMEEPHRTLVLSEHMPNGSLEKVLLTHSIELKWRARANIATGVASAMTYLEHCKPPIIHHSFSSTNVLLDDSFNAKVSDYGLESVRAAAAKKNQAISMQCVAWTAPEVAEPGAKQTAASNVYAFGILLWELWTRRIPFEDGERERAFVFDAAKQVQIMKDVANGARPTIELEMPEPYVKLMQMCWDQDPDKRPTFRVILDRLKSFEHADYDLHLKNAKKLQEEKQEEDEWDESEFVGLSWVVKFDELTVGDPIGQGSFGKVYQAEFRGKQVAVKMLLDDLVGRSHHQSFINELNVINSLRNQNVVLFIGACLDKDHKCIIMEYLDKGSLYDVLHDKTQQISYQQIIQILTGISRGMHYLHANDILHRDLKSLNILLDSEWGVRVADFGLTATKHTTSHTTHLGTPFWMSPEAMEFQQFSKKSDVYSFGMIMWEIFTRRTPFPDMTPHQAALAVITRQARPKIPHYVPNGLATLIKACWHQDPSMRPNFEGILVALDRLAKMGLPKLELATGNSGLYQKKTRVNAFQTSDVVIVYKAGMSTKAGMRCKRNDWVVVGTDDDVYTCDDVIFRKTYGLVEGTIQEFKKTGKIRARPMPNDFLIETLEGMEYGTAHDYLAQNADAEHGEQWPIKKKTFEKMYELVPEEGEGEEEKKEHEPTEGKKDV